MEAGLQIVRPPSPRLIDTPQIRIYLSYDPINTISAMKSDCCRRRAWRTLAESGNLTCKSRNPSVTSQKRVDALRPPARRYTVRVIADASGRCSCIPPVSQAPALGRRTINNLNRLSRTHTTTTVPSPECLLFTMLRLSQMLSIQVRLWRSFCDSGKVWARHRKAAPLSRVYRCHPCSNGRISNLSDSHAVSSNQPSISSA
ncbi:hypothetical protein K402DRAFT_269732 [Aulographum hederae CBS 113979]|uniref:Uncharacterized protein n=1 Tax=Aulographum hederae CBS 113979 TaxID=1176131 RepID=A0A6G1H7W9_9PEZI|nr:hypothetical protein K402DRAFT_269732 [Aulographum hederae CBS 113979]